MGLNYVLGARAKGLRRRVAITKHGFPNALLPIVTIMGLQIGGLLSGAVLTETIFSFPGLGRILFESIIVHDYPVVQMITLVVTVIYVTANLIVDLSYAILDILSHQTGVICAMGNIEPTLVEIVETEYPSLVRTGSMWRISNLATFFGTVHPK